MTTVQSIYHEAGIFRGYFINHVSYIEKIIEFHVASHFCRDNERAKEMVDLLTGDRFVSFESKRTSFENILKRHHFELYKSSKEYFAKLTTIQNNRNRLAHLIVFSAEEAIEKYRTDKVIGFIKFGVDTKPIWYDDKQKKELLEMLEDIAEWLKTISLKQ